MIKKKIVVYAIIPARSGSKGVKNKNIKPICGLPLISHSIRFAKKLGVDKVICSTDSEEYKKIAEKYGAEVPFLRSAEAASDTAMEQHILVDLYQKFEEHNIPMPDFLVWLRPTFVFRDVSKVQKCIDMLIEDESLTSARTVCRTESRLYSIDENILRPQFEDNGKSMIRRQDVLPQYKVYSTDVIRASKENVGDDFLGNKVGAVVIPNICGLDIDDEVDFRIVEGLITHNKALVNEYLS